MGGGGGGGGGGEGMMPPLYLILNGFVTGKVR